MYISQCVKRDSMCDVRVFSACITTIFILEETTFEQALDEIRGVYASLVYSLATNTCMHIHTCSYNTIYSCGTTYTFTC
jgi:uncharacterized membrane protein YoaK (UPF0700 family)